MRVQVVAVVNFVTVDSKAKAVVSEQTFVRRRKRKYRNGVGMVYNKKKGKK